MTGTMDGVAHGTALDAILPTPRLRETDTIDLALTPAQAWQAIRYGDLARSPLIKALFAVRGLPGRITRREAETEQATVRIEDLVSSPDKPGFQVLADDEPHEVVVGAIGKVWRLDIPFVHVASADAFAAFKDPGFIKVAWAIRLTAISDRDTNVEFEVRVAATDEAAWRTFRRYLRVIGPASRFIRRSALAGLARAHGTPGGAENGRPLPGDELLPDAIGQMTHAVTVRAQPTDIWPWLVQMGCRRGGFYSVDLLDNGTERSAREIHRDLQQIAVGDILPAAPKGVEGFEVLRVKPPTELILGGLFDLETKRQLAFDAARPSQFWHVTWAFVLEPRRGTSTRLHVRARAAFPDSARLHAVWLRQLHNMMQRAQLRHLAARAEGRLRRDDWRDILAGTAGATIMAAGLLTPFRRATRNRWGVEAEIADRRFPGDELVPEPRWSWTHGIEVAAAADDVWPWVAQIGADRGGFYSYQWLENIVGCDVRNAETIHPEWAAREGGELRLHPKLPLRVVSVSPGRSLVAFAGPAPDQPDASQPGSGHPGRRWIAASWLFFVEPLGARRCRLISRYRCASADDLASRLQFGPALLEPIGFAMDRRMLLGVKRLAERARRDDEPAAVRQPTRQHGLMRGAGPV